MIRLIIPLLFLPALLIGQAEVYISAAFNDHSLPYSSSRFSALADAQGMGDSDLGLNLGIDLYFRGKEEKLPFLISLNHGTVFSSNLRLPYSIQLPADATGPARRVFAQVSLESFNYWQLGVSLQPLRISKKRNYRLAVGGGLNYISGPKYHYALGEQENGADRLRPAQSAYRIESGALFQIDGPARLEMNDELLRPLSFYGEIGLVSSSSKSTQSYTMIQVNLGPFIAEHVPDNFIKRQLWFTLKMGFRGRLF